MFLDIRSISWVFGFLESVRERQGLYTMNMGEFGIS